MKRITLLACLCLAFVWGCSKKDSSSSSGSTSGSTTSASRSGCFASQNVITTDFNKIIVKMLYDSKLNLTEVITTLSSGTIANDNKLEYNSAGQIIKSSSVGSSSYQTFEYSGNQLTKFSDYTMSNLTDYSTFRYNSSGLVDKMTTYASSGVSTGHDSITYDGIGNVSRVDKFDAQGNSKGYTLYTYDAKKSPYAVMNFNYILFRAAYKTWGPNNYMSIRNYDFNGNVSSDSTNVSYSYTTKDYPDYFQITPSNGSSEKDSITYNCH